MTRNQSCESKERPRVVAAAIPSDHLPRMSSRKPFRAGLALAATARFSAAKRHVGKRRPDIFAPRKQLLVRSPAFRRNPSNLPPKGGTTNSKNRCFFPSRAKVAFMVGAASLRLRLGSPSTRLGTLSGKAAMHPLQVSQWEQELVARLPEGFAHKLDVSPAGSRPIKRCPV